MTGRFLPSDAANLIVRLYRTQRLLIIVVPLLLWAGITGILRQRFQRGGSDLVIFALVVSVAICFVSACLYLLFTQPGYHF
jgi:hypothetical protein